MTTPRSSSTQAPWRQWLRACMAGGVVLFSGSLLAATPIPAGPLVTTEWLAQNLDNQQVRIVEVSVVPGVYERGHIPGAVNFAWHSDLVDPVRRDIASQENFQALLRKAGISADTTTVLYGDNHNWFAAWGAWVFDVYGVENVKLLDGGRGKWEAEKRPLDNRVQTPAAGSVTLKAAQSTGPAAKAGLYPSAELSRNLAQCWLEYFLTLGQLLQHKQLAERIKEV